MLTPPPCANRLLVLVSQRPARAASLSLTGSPPQPSQGEAAAARLLRALHAPLAPPAPLHPRAQPKQLHARLRVLHTRTHRHSSSRGDEEEMWERTYGEAHAAVRCGLGEPRGLLVAPDALDVVPPVRMIGLVVGDIELSHGYIRR